MKTQTDQIVKDEKSIVNETQQNSSKVTEQNKGLESLNDIIEEEKYYFDDARCCQGNQCVFICASKTCQQNAIVCGSRKCPCRKVHKQNGYPCRLIDPETMVKTLESKIIKNPNIQKQIKQLNQQLQKIIDYVSEFEETLTYFGLQDDQRNFLNLAHRKRYQQMKGSFVHEINIKANSQGIQNHEEWKNQDIIKQLQNLNKYLFQDIKSQINLISDVADRRLDWIRNKDLLQRSKQVKVNLYTDKIETYRKQSLIKPTISRFNIDHFFNKPIKQYQLIYKASENNFSTERFWDAYKGQPNTLFVIKTEFNKVIGGYTPLVWAKNEGNDQVYADPSKQSFVFSLTNNDRFDLVDSKCAIRYSGKQCGPIFGGSGSSFILKICNKSNIEYLSDALFNCSYYKNNKYTANNKQSYKLFLGSDSYHFKINQWQAFQVIFDQ